MEPQENQYAPLTETESTAPTPAKATNISLPAAIVTGAAILGLAIVLAFGPRGTTTTTPPPAGTDTSPTSVAKDIATVRASDYVRGNSNAEVAIIEYSDSDCPYCEQFHATMKSTFDSYNGKVSWVYRFFPLETLHPNAYTEATALACVGELGGNTAFWTYLDTIINVVVPADAKSSDTLIAYATKEGIDAKLLKTCMQSDVTKKRVDAGIAEAKKIGARGTPFSIAVNTKTGEQTIIPGAVPAEYLKQIIDDLLK